MQHIEEVSEVAALEQRWANSWATSLRAQYVFYTPNDRCLLI